MHFNEPLKVYTAATNVEAHLIVEMLRVNDIAALADEDQSGVSLWSFGTISQFHQPNIWIDRSNALKSAELIRLFEEDKRQRENAIDVGEEIEVECEECETISRFPNRLNGTTQECPHCSAYVDVGKIDWNEDVGEPET